MTYLKIEFSVLEFQNGPRSILRLTWFKNSYHYDAMCVCVKPKVEIQSRSTLKKESFEYLRLFLIKFLL